MKKRTIVVAVIITAITLTQKAEAGLLDSIGTIAKAISASNDKKKTNPGHTADPNPTATPDSLNQGVSDKAASATDSASPSDAGNTVSVDPACMSQMPDEPGKPVDSPEGDKPCAARTNTNQEQQAVASAETIKKPPTNEDIQREIAEIYADPNISDANKSVLRQMEAKMPPDVTPEQHAKVLKNYRALLARTAQMPQQSVSPYQAQKSGALEGVGSLVGGMAASRTASQSAYDTAMSGGGLGSSRAVINQVGNGGGSGGAANGVKAELLMEGAKAVGGFIGSLFKKKPANETAGTSNEGGN